MMEEKKNTPSEELERIRAEVNELEKQGYNVLGEMSFSDSPEKDKDDYWGHPLTDTFAPDTSVGRAMISLSQSVSPSAEKVRMSSYSGGRGVSGNGLKKEDAVKIEDFPESDGYIPWGKDNRLPNFICNASYSLPYTARSIGFLVNQIVGLGVEFIYRWPRFVNGEVIIKQIPYKDAGFCIRNRIAELRQKKNSDENVVEATFNFISADSEGNARPGTVEYEIQRLEQDYRTWERVNAEVEEFVSANGLHNHFLSCMEDFVPMEIYFPLLGLSVGEPGKEWHPKIVSLRKMDAVASRKEAMDNSRQVSHVFYSDVWRQDKGSILSAGDGDFVKYPSLPEVGALSKLRKIVNSKRNKGVRSRPTWFCIPRRLPSMNSLYYTSPKWWSIFYSKVYDYAATFISDRATARMNSTMWGKIIMVNHQYLQSMWAQNGCDTVEKKKAYRMLLKAKIDTFLRNRDNNGSTAMFETIPSVDGKELWDSIKIIDVPLNKNENVSANKTELTEISNVIFMAMGIHSALIGNEINAGSSTGGTFQRELDLLKQKQVAPMQKDYLELLNFIRDFNEWDSAHGEWRVNTMSLTTLDASKTGTTVVNDKGEKV